MEIDQLSLLRGRPIKINNYLTIKQPTIGEIEEAGEARFFNTFWTLCSCAWDMPSFFDDLGIDFMSISDWSFFMQISKGFSQDDTKLIFGDLDFSKFETRILITDENEEERIPVLTNVEPIVINGIEYGIEEYLFTEQMYQDSINIIREMIGFSHQGRKAKNKATAKVLILDDRKRKSRNKDKSYESIFFNGIISLVNTEEFSYTYETAFELTMYQFTKSLLQISGKKQACALLQGSMSGFVDTKGIPSKSFQWQYSEDKYKRTSGKTLKGSLSPNGGSLNVK